MPDENDATGADEKEIPSTPLHAHGSKIEEDSDRPRTDEIEGDLLEDDEDRADEATNTGGATSGGRAPRRARPLAGEERRWIPNEHDEQTESKHGIDAADGGAEQAGQPDVTRPPGPA